MQIIILIGIAVSFLFFAIGAIWLAAEEHKERKQKEKELKEIIANENNAAEIITEANKTKADARTGDHERDFNYMADKLHEFANQ